MKFITKVRPVFITFALLFSGCEMMMPAESTALDTESILEEAERHNEVMEEEVKKQTKLLEEISKTLKAKQKMR